MNKNLHIFLVFVGLWLASVASAQMITIPYSMSFEEADSLEMNNWVINPGAAAPQCADFWYNGPALHSDGRRGMYIVCEDSVHMPTYAQANNLQFFYRDFQFPKGSFVITFDYLIESEPNAELYVGYTMFGTSPTTAANAVTANATSSVMPSTLVNAKTLTNLGHAGTWQTVSLPRLSNATAGQYTYRVFFAWSNNTAGGNGKLSVAVDNIQITDARYSAPSRLDVTSTGCDSVILNWDITSDGYEINYRRQGASSWSRNFSESSNPGQLVLENLAEGSYDFRIRTINHDADGNVAYSPWFNAGEVIVFCADLHCINYVDLADPSVHCFTGTYTTNTYTYTSTPDPGQVDYGPESPASRHTVVWDRTAKDPRTGGVLSMVPSGSLASVRLHTWNPTGNYFSSVEYDMTVDSARSILIVKYALVQEYASHHSPDLEEQARFYVQILDQNGNLIDPTCGQKTMRAGYDSESWEWQGKADGRPLTSEDVVWKDWTTMGMDLSPYIGQTIRIHLESSGCSQSAHYGYAYFTLDCKEAQIVSNSCGDSEGTYMDVEAPEGFTYEWINSHNQTVSTNRTFAIPSSDTTTYTCRLRDMENPTCYFELTTASRPRYPRASFSYTYEPANCENRYIFTNNSYILTRWNGVTERHNEDCSGYQWDFGSGQTDGQKNVIHTFPQSGGTFRVNLAAWLGDGTGACYNDTTIVINVPKIGNDTVREEQILCEGEWIEVDGKRYFSDTTITRVKTSRAGCDSVNMLRVKIAPSYMSFRKDTICYGDKLCFGDDCWDGKVSPWRRVYPTVKHGCDSVIIDTVHVMPKIDPVLDIHSREDMKDIAYVKVLPASSGFNRYELINDRDGSVMTSLSDLMWGSYTMKFYNEFDCEHVEQIEILQPCLDAIYQRWDDVLSLKNDSIQKIDNCGFSFPYVSFMWVKDGMPLVNETKSYYYEEGGLTGTVYTCIVYDADGNEQAVCDFYPVPWTPSFQQNGPTRKLMVNGELVIDRNGNRYNAQGARMY